MVGFVGPNGAGKTTAMRIALGVLEADGGEVRWRGRVVDGVARRRFGYIPEERGLYPKMRVLEQLVYLARLHGVSRAAARPRDRRSSRRSAWPTRSKDRVESLSLGNQQRVQLAAALVHEPDVLVLDEPFSGLDPVGADVLIEVLDRERAIARRADRVLQPSARARGARVRPGRDDRRRPDRRRGGDRRAPRVAGRAGSSAWRSAARRRGLVRVGPGGPAGGRGSRRRGPRARRTSIDDQRVLDLARSVGRGPALQPGAAHAGRALP